MSSKLSREQVLAALEQVMDPELRENIVNLNMVRDIAIDPQGRLGITIALTVPACPLHDRIRSDVEAALEPLAGAWTALDIHLTSMTEDERRQAFRQAYQLAQGRRQQASGGSTAPPRPGPSGPVIGPLPGQQVLGGAFLNAERPPRLIGVASGKGGVGKSTVTANLAVALARRGLQVGVMDMDIYGFSQGRLLGAEGPARANAEKKVIPWFVNGVHLVSMGMFVGEDQAVVWRGPMLGKMLTQFFTDVAWPPLDYLVIDLPPGTGDVALDLAQRIQDAALILVTTPQEVAVHVARRAAEVAQRAEQRILGVVENMAYVRCPHGEVLQLFGSGGGTRLADQLGVPLLAQIPIEAAVREGGDAGRPAALHHPDSEAGRAFLHLADMVMGALPAAV